MSTLTKDSLAEGLNQKLNFPVAEAKELVEMLKVLVCGRLLGGQSEDKPVRNVVRLQLVLLGSGSWPMLLVALASYAARSRSASGRR